MGIHVIVGAGPLGRSVARHLVNSGDQVRLVSRRGTKIRGTEATTADATRPDQLAGAVADAEVLYNCANVPYHRWTQDLPPLWNTILETAKIRQIPLVIGTNLYAYGKPKGPLHADQPLSANTRKGKVRAELELQAIKAHESGDLPVAIVRASDFFGPEAEDSVVGGRFFRSILGGKPAVFYGSLITCHHYTYLPDFGRTIATVGNSAAFGATWHVPSAQAVTAYDLADIIEGILSRSVKTSLMGMGMLRIGGLFIPAAREIIEMLYEFNAPFLVDSKPTEEILGLTATPLETALKETIGWFSDQASDRGLPRRQRISTIAGR